MIYLIILIDQFNKVILKMNLKKYFTLTQIRSFNLFSDKHTLKKSNTR